ncbi:MAG: GtrA family protein [Clostridiales bacterium]|nr:GtrA family protein [Clostridiales bacterium]
MRLKTIVVGGEHLTPQQEKLRKIFMYVVSGGITTVVSLASFKLFNMFVPDLWKLSAFGKEISLKLAINKVVCWIIAVLVAYFLNRITVFRSKGKIFNELLKFAGARILSFLIFEEGLFLLSVFICTKVTGLPSDTVVTTVLGIGVTYADVMNLVNLVFVMIANYVMSKIMVFKKEDMVDYSKKDDEEQTVEPSAAEAEEGAANA